MSDLYASILAVAVATWTMVAFYVDRRLFFAVLPHNLAWIVACAIVGSGVMNYDPLTFFAWAVITGAIVAYNMGVALTRGNPAGAVGREVVPRPLTSLRIYVLLLLGFVAGFAVYLWTINSHYGVGLLLTDPSSIRAYSEQDPGYLERFPLYGKVLFYLGPLCFALTLCPDLVRGLRDKPKILRFGVAAFVLIAQAGALQRTHIFVSVAMVVGIALLRAGAGTPALRRRPAGKRVGAVLLLGIVSVLAFQGLAVALGKTGTDDPESTYSVDPSVRGSSVVAILHYAASGIPAFSKLAESRDDRWPDPNDLGNTYGDYNPQTWGTATFAAGLKLVPGVTTWERIAPFTEVPTKTNVYTWLEPWYRDFRAPGAIAGALLVGMLVGTAAKMAGRSSTALVLGGIVLGFTGLATFVNRYAAVMSIILYLVIWWLGRPRPAGADPGSAHRRSGDGRPGRAHRTPSRVGGPDGMKG